MSRLERLKLENIKKANELLDWGHVTESPDKEEIELQPSSNVTSSSTSFVNKMNNLHESKLLTEADAKFSPLTINFGEIEMGTQWEDLSDEEKIEKEKYKSQYGGYTIQHTIKWEDIKIMIDDIEKNKMSDSQDRWTWVEGPEVQEAIETLWNKVKSGEADVWN